MIRTHYDHTLELYIFFLNSTYSCGQASADGTVRRKSGAAFVQLLMLLYTMSLRRKDLEFIVQVPKLIVFFLFLFLPPNVCKSERARGGVAFKVVSPPCARREFVQRASSFGSLAAAGSSVRTRGLAVVMGRPGGAAGSAGSGRTGPEEGTGSCWGSPAVVAGTLARPARWGCACGGAATCTGRR